jgi:hypothetical protein
MIFFFDIILNPIKNLIEKHLSFKNGLNKYFLTSLDTKSVGCINQFIPENIHIKSTKTVPPFITQL